MPVDRLRLCKQICRSGIKYSVHGPAYAGNIGFDLYFFIVMTRPVAHAHDFAKTLIFYCRFDITTVYDIIGISFWV